MIRRSLSVLALAAFLVAPIVAFAKPPEAAKPQRWPAAVTYSVVHNCRALLRAPLEQCGCFAEHLEALSPEPATPATEDEVRKAIQACGITVPKPTPEPLNHGSKEI